MPWIRIAVAWSALEPDGPGGAGGEQAWLQLDDELRYARSRGLRTLVALADAPDWASGRPGATSDPPAPARLWRYGSFLRTLATRLGGLIDAYAPWNEPNTTYSWQPVNARAYARLQTTAYDALKPTDPTALVLSAAIAGGRDSAYGYLRQAYAAGLRGHLDVLAWNAYPSGPPEGGPGEAARRLPSSSSLAGQRYLRSMLDRLDPGRPIWITEMGWSTCRPCSHFANNSASEATQADYLLRAYVYRRRYLGGSTERIFWYGVLDGPDPRAWNQNTGLVRADLAPKPAYRAMRLLAVPGAHGLGARSGTVPPPALPAAAARSVAGPASFDRGGSRVALGVPEVAALDGTIALSVDVRFEGGATRLAIEGYGDGAWRPLETVRLTRSSRVRARITDHGYLALLLRAGPAGAGPPATRLVRLDRPSPAGA